MKKTILHIAFLFALVASCAAQHVPVVSQYMLNGLPLNPAFTGSRDALSIAGSYRNQWTGYEGAPVNQTFGIHTPLKNDAIGVGLLLFNDHIGVSNESGVHAMASYRLKLGEGKLSFGLSGGISNYRNQWSNVVTTDSGDRVFSSGNDQYILPNFSAGMYYYTKSYYVSLSSPFILSQKYSGVNEYRASNNFSHYNILLNAGWKYNLNQNFSVIPSAMLKVGPGSPMQLDVNAMVGYKEIVEAGFSYRTGDAIIALVKMHPTGQFTVGYAFDYTISNLGTYTGVSHEVTLMYDFKYKTNISSPRFF
ncbi:MAG: type IX secretion system PorP/SprF family membrane protein [Flavobacteriales bacterium]|jgi:type IX secretion system PorP/SprF family membrane protein